MKRADGGACDGGLKPTLRGWGVAHHWRSDAGVCVRVLLLVAVGVLAGCGKKGSPSAPGPTEELTFPRVYPSR